MSNSLIDIIGVVPVQMVFAYALSRMLVMRNLPLYLTLEFATALLVSYLRSSMEVEARLIATVVFALLPLVFSKGALSRRILAVILAHLVLYFVELPGGAVWTAMTGTSIVNYDAAREHFDAFIITHVAHMALLVALLVVLCLLFDQFADSAQKVGRWLPTVFTVVQLMLVSVMLLLAFWYVGPSPFYYGFSIPLSLLGLAADALLLYAMGRVAEKRNADMHAAMLEEQIDQYLARYGTFVEDIKQAAKLRHDMKNQMQVVLALSERKRFDEAREHLALIRSVLSAGNTREGKAS